MSDTNVTEGVHTYSNEKAYIAPEEALLQQRLEWFKDQKLGLMMHWGPYSQLGLVESWALSDADAEWSREDVDWVKDATTFKQQYVDLNKSFNPLRFQPEEWADLAKENGFKYLVFTTKHHDGFAMWDTQTTDYKVTGNACPYRTNPNADVCKQLFDAFRERGLAISAYFSKADWHVPSYWDKESERTSRGPSYDPAEDPERWESFVQFTHEQMLELLTKYGRIEVLWLDAGWVSAKNKQDIRLGDVIEKARRTQPWLLAADRTVGGRYENIITPEQMVPQEPIHVPWESCITMGSAFSFRYEDDYKSARALVHLLIEVVSKGGNLALNVAPQPDGRLPKGAVQSMKGLVLGLTIMVKRFTQRDLLHLIFKRRSPSHQKETRSIAFSCFINKKRWTDVKRQFLIWRRSRRSSGCMTVGSWHFKEALAESSLSCRTGKRMKRSHTHMC
ncbi:alpha-L-fucosidase [Bacillus sp. JCM 19045]|nr:alpha-L-fucosidase [Bacillus sp. JCM 19045]